MTMQGAVGRPRRQATRSDKPRSSVEGLPRPMQWEEKRMSDITRRRILKAGVAAVGAGLLPAGTALAAPAWNGPAPEPGAQIRVLRWKQFIQAEFDSFVANTKKFVEQTGVQVRVNAESWDDILPKA